jgi:hypothetical protein
VRPDTAWRAAARAGSVHAERSGFPAIVVAPVGKIIEPTTAKD